jgi:hypothetical protein
MPAASGPSMFAHLLAPSDAGRAAAEHRGHSQKQFQSQLQKFTVTLPDIQPAKPTNPQGSQRLMV